MSNIKKNISGIIIIYISVALLYQILWLIAPVRAFLFDTGLDIISSGLAVLGFALFLWDAITDRAFLKSRYTKLLIAIIGALCLSCLVNINYGLDKNARVLVWQVVQMLVMFPLCYRVREELFTRFLVCAHMIAAVVFVPAVILSIYQFCCNISYVIVIDGINCKQGFQDGRAFGVFASIYYASLFLSIMTVATVYMAVRAKNTCVRLLYLLESVLFLIYIIISGTRSVQVGLFTALFIGAFCFFWNNGFLRCKIRAGWLRSVVCLALSSIVVCCGVLMYQNAESALDSIPLYIEKVNTQHQSDTNEGAVTDKVTDKDDSEKAPTTNQSPVTNKVPSTDKKPVVVDRPSTEEDNISNNRFEIWKDYLEITFDSIKAVIFGYGPGSYMDAIKEASPDSFIVSKIKDAYPAMYERGYICDTHNSYLSILVSAGMIGVIVMCLFLLVCVKKVFLYLFSMKKPKGSIIALSMLITVIMVTVFFDSDLFFKCTDTSMIFWILSGFLMKKVDSELEKIPADTEQGHVTDTE